MNQKWLPSYLMYIYNIINNLSIIIIISFKIYVYLWKNIIY